MLRGLQSFTYGTEYVSCIVVDTHRDKFLDKYRVQNARAEWWNYADGGIYFITIRSAKGAHLFGNINYGEMHLSAIGEIVQQELEKSFEIRDELFCDLFVIMPNHVHAVLRVENRIVFNPTTAQKHKLWGGISFTQINIIICCRI